MIDAFSLFKVFDESTYLKNNPDVSAAVEAQSFASGLEHFLLFGINEHRPGVPKALVEYINFQNADLKQPPSNLRARVHGTEGLQEFNKIGRLLSYILSSSFLSLAENERGNRVFDFGCGCGRVIGYLSKLFVDNHFYGSDIDLEAITWCQENLSDICEFTTNDALPPLHFDNSYFDFVYSISVFTHLPEDMQFRWLEELKRITKKGGYLLITTHGETLAPQDVQQVLKDSGFYYATGVGTDGLPDFYQTSFHTEQYIRHHWGSYFEIVKFMKKGILNHQDLVICRNTG
ncbi:MAG: class I SAM-dependent methyltransferase [Candidatus Thiodiazotropha endolucinida]